MSCHNDSDQNTTPEQSPEAPIPMEELGEHAFDHMGDVMTGTQREVGERIVDDIVGPAAVGGVVGFAGRALGYLDDFAAAVTAVIVAGAGFIWNKINPFDCPPTSPLVIDLDGDGIELTSLGDSNAFFDLNVDGFAERTGWVQSDDGLLALDINGNGEIDDNSELFGNATGFDNGFLQLAELDSNDDGVIDGNDTGFAELQIWRDFDQDGVSDSGELQALSDAGIASISLDAIEVEETNLDHLVTDRSTVTFTDGTNGIIEDVHFQNDTTLAYKLLPDEFEFHPTALALPLLWGFGQIASSWVSYSEDQVLRDEAVSLVNQLATGDVTGFLEDFEGFVLIWAGVADVPADSRGEHIDARKLAFLEKMHGTAFVDQYGGSNPRVNAGVELEMYFEETVKQLAGVFMAQSAVSKGFLDAYEADNLAAFQPSFEGNPLSVFTNLVNVTSGERTLSGDLSEVLAGLQNSIENGEITTANAIAAVMLLKTDFSSNEKEFHLLLQVAVVKAGLDPTTDFITALTFADDQQLLDGATGNDTITADSASYIRAGAGDDIVTGSAGQDLIYGGEGNDTLNGGGGADIYVYSLGDGSDTIKDYSTKSENDRLVFTDVNADDVTFSQNSGKDLIITLSNGDTITITDHFDNGWEDMELIEFADGTVLDLAGIAAKTISDQNGDGDDVVRGSTGADTFHGGVGNDTLIGGTGADTYIYSLGDGSDTIKDYSTRSEDDRLVFTDLNADDVTFSQNSGKDLIITLSNGDTITITDHFDNGWEDMELIEFADGTVLDLAGIAAKTISDQNGDGDDVVRGSTGADTFHGGVGNDTLIGGTGADTYIYSLGDGSDTIKDYSTRSEDDRLVFTDLNADDVTFSQNSGKDLIITLSNGDTITITDHFDNGWEDMELIEFADGTVLDLAGIAAKTISDQNGDGDDVVRGSNGADTFHGGVGNDTLIGGAGADTYIYSLGNGSDTINDNSSYGTDRLVFTDVNADDVTFSQNGGKDLVITLSNGETVTITDHFDNSKEQMEQIEFADGTVLDLAGIAAKSLLGGSGDDTIVGFSTDDVLSGGAGDDVLTGGAGADEFVFDTQTASGADRITDFELNSDQIQLAGSSYADLTFVDTGSGTLVEWDNGSVELDGIAVASLTEDQFSFV